MACMTSSPTQGTLGCKIPCQTPSGLLLLNLFFEGVKGVEKALNWWLGMVVWEFEPLVLVEGKWETTPGTPPNHRTGEADFPNGHRGYGSAHLCVCAALMDTRVAFQWCVCARLPWKFLHYEVWKVCPVT